MRSFGSARLHNRADLIFVLSSPFSGSLRLEANRLQTRVVDEICALRDQELFELVVDCPIDVDGESFGVVCAIPDCCTSCEPLI